MPKQQDQLQSLHELLVSGNSISKACTLGLIIDSTNAYYDDSKKQYMKKIKIIDSSLNLTSMNRELNYGYCLVMFFAAKADHLPNPRAIGDIIYLRRFAFNKYNNQFQSHSNPAQYCSWALLAGDIQEKDYAEYQTSRIGMNLNEEKYGTLSSSVKELRVFGREFLEKYSIMNIFPVGMHTKDTDIIVHVIRRRDERTLRVKDCKGRQLLIRDCLTFAQQGDFAKLRSLARLQQINHEHVVVPNNFTSLLVIPKWTFDAQDVIRNDTNMQAEDQVFTGLAILTSGPVSNCCFMLDNLKEKSFLVKCEVLGISAMNFYSAVKFYDRKKRTISDNKSENAKPIYKIQLHCTDSSLSPNELVEVWVLSYDGKCSDFVKSFRLKDFNELSSQKHEDIMYEKRVNELLQAEGVKMLVEVLTDGKGNRMLRAIDIDAY